MLDRRIFVLALCAVWPPASNAALVIEPARPITHKVTVQIIETALSDGTLPATIFGNAAQRAEIESAIDTVWAQAGIDVAFLPSIVRYDDTFAYQGSGGTRPGSDLRMITSRADSAGVVNSDPTVINMFFVDIVPGFRFTSENSANGIGNIGNGGIAQFVGDNLLTFPNGREVIAEVVAHEIGHNLGLLHAPDRQPNLMSPGGTSAQLTGDQIAAIFQTTARNDSVAFIPYGGTGFVQPISTHIANRGDYNGNGVVDAADYVVWRDAVGSSAALSADGNGNSVVDAGDYSVWRNQFGAVDSPGTAGRLQLGPTSAVPEPAALTQVACGLAALLAGSIPTAARRRRAAAVVPSIGPARIDRRF